MARHFFRLRYDGLLASRSELAPSASKQVVEGAQMFLGAHAHYFLTGRLPERINDKGPGYEITDLARQANSWEANFAIHLLAEGVWDAARYAFPMLIYDSFRAWSQGRVYEDPPIQYRDPYLGACSMPNEPSFDPERWYQQERLHRRVGRALAHMSAGIGSSALALELTIDDHMFAILDRRVPLVSEDEVTEGLTLFRQTAEAARRRRLN
jgi:hypothetical protein